MPRSFANLCRNIGERLNVLIRQSIFFWYFSINIAYFSPVLLSLILMWKLYQLYLNCYINCTKLRNHHGIFCWTHHIRIYCTHIKNHRYNNRQDIPTYVQSVFELQFTSAGSEWIIAIMFVGKLSWALQIKYFLRWRMFKAVRQLWLLSNCWSI